MRKLPTCDKERREKSSEILRKCERKKEEKGRETNKKQWSRSKKKK